MSNKQEYPEKAEKYVLFRFSDVEVIEPNEDDSACLVTLRCGKQYYVLMSSGCFQEAASMIGYESLGKWPVGPVGDDPYSDSWGDVWLGPNVSTSRRIK